MRRCRPSLGTFVEIEGDCAEAIDAGFAAIERVHRLMSAHEAASELSRINRFAHLRPVAVSADTMEVLKRALHWSRISGGAFDIARAGAQALAQSRLPRHPDQPDPDQAADWTDVRLGSDAVSLDRRACLDLGGIAKGYAVDLGVAALKNAGASSGLVNAGGDLRVFGDRGWLVTIVEPATRRGLVEVELDKAALATSAGLGSSGGLCFAHLTAIDPRWTSITVRAPNACDADALAKIVWALGHRSADLLSAAGADAFAVRAEGGVEAIGQRALAA